MAHSKEYLEELKVLHSKKTFGTSSNIPEDVSYLIKKYNIKSILDFGSGKGNVSKSLKDTYPDITVYSYDPVTSPIDLPQEVDLVYSSDVLEHVEPELIKETLDTLFSISKYQYHLIACHPAKKALSDGRNAHLIIESPEWWKQQLTNCTTNTTWRIESSNSKIHYGKTKKAGILEQCKYIVTLIKE